MASPTPPDDPAAPTPAGVSPAPAGRASANAAGDPLLTRLREFTATGLAAIVVAGTVALTIVAVLQSGDADRFPRIKDLLLFLNPLVGVVVGYYFNRVTGEARAENAETLARDGAQAATEAGQAQRAAESRTADVVAALGALTAAHSEGPTGPSTLGRSGPAPQHRPDLAVALSRARSVLGWQTEPSTPQPRTDSRS